MIFTPEELRQIRTGDINATLLCETQFKSETMLLHNGTGILLSADGREWQGIGGQASFEGLQSSTMNEARSSTVTLNSQEQIFLDAFENQVTEVKGRKFIFYLQAYNAQLQPIGTLYQIYTGIGDFMRMSVEQGGGRMLSLSMEDRGAARRKNAHSRITQSDQNKRDPGSTGFAQVNAFKEWTINLYDAG